MFRTALTDFFCGRGKSLAYVGTALALTGASSAAIAATSSTSPAPGIASAARSLSDDAGTQHGPAVTAGIPAASKIPPAGHPTASHDSASHDSASHDSASHDSASHEGASHDSASRKSGAHQAASRKVASHQTAGHQTAGHQTAGHKAAGHQTAGHKAAANKTVAHKAVAHKAVAHKAAKRAGVHVVRHSHRLTTWKQVRDALADQTFPKAAPGKLPLADRLLPGSASGPQAYMPVTASRRANATTIVHRALTKHMGIRAAVIAVATAMQESTLENINYGDRDSLGLFQQRPSAGWGTPAEVTDPTYAADAFLDALRSHQRADPDWASQPLWENAQAVQDSGFPYAYAKWESQAAQLVSDIARNMS